MSAGTVEAVRATVEAQDKTFRTAQARAALQGATLHLIGDEHNRAVFMLAQGPWVNEFATLAEVDAVLDRMEGRR